MGAFRGGGRRGGGVGKLIEGGGVGRPDGKILQILDLHRLACISDILCHHCVNHLKALCYDTCG